MMEAIQDLSMETGEMQVVLSALQRVRERIREVSETHRPLFGGAHFLPGKEVCERLYISPRTLQDYRDRKVSPTHSSPARSFTRFRISKGSWKRIIGEAVRPHIYELKTALGSRGRSAPSVVFSEAALIMVDR